MSKPIHAHKAELFCNRCEKYVNKWTGTIIVDGQVVCLCCGNWLCGEYDAFGVLDMPTIEHIRHMAREMNG